MNIVVEGVKTDRVVDEGITVTEAVGERYGAGLCSWEPSSELPGRGTTGKSTGRGELGLGGSREEVSVKEGVWFKGGRSRFGIFGGGISSEVSVLSRSLFLFGHRNATQEEHLQSLGCDRILLLLYVVHLLWWSVLQAVQVNTLSLMLIFFLQVTQ